MKIPEANGQPIHYSSARSIRYTSQTSDKFNQSRVIRCDRQSAPDFECRRRQSCTSAHIWRRLQRWILWSFRRDTLIYRYISWHFHRDSVTDDRSIVHISSLSVYFFFRKTNEVFLTAFYHLHFTKSSDSKSIKHHSDRGYQKMGYEGRRIMECARSMAIPECQEEFVESESKFRKWIRKICCIACKMPDWKTALPRKMKSPSRIDWESGGRRHSCATRRAIAADDHLYVFL